MRLIFERMFKKVRCKIDKLFFLKDDAAFTRNKERILRLCFLGKTLAVLLSFQLLAGIEFAQY